MRVSEALWGIKNTKYGMALEISQEEILRFKGDIRSVIKGRMARDLADDIVKSDKLEVEESFQPHDGTTEYRAEVFILTRKEIEQLISNVVQDTMMKMRQG